MTYFESLCHTLGVRPGSAEELIVRDMVDEMIFDENHDYSVPEILSTVEMRFRALYSFGSPVNK